MLVWVVDGWREELGGELRDSGVTLRRLPVRIWPFDLLIGQPKFVRATWRDDVLEDRPGTDALLCFRDMAALQSKIITMYFYHRGIAEKFGFLTLCSLGFASSTLSILTS